MEDPKDGGIETPPSTKSEPTGGGTDGGELATLKSELETVKAENLRLASANQGFVAQVGTLTEAANLTKTQNEELTTKNTELAAAVEAAKALHVTEQTNHAQTHANLLIARRNTVTATHGIPADKLAELDASQLAALETVLPSLTSKGFDLGSGGGGRNPSDMTPTENALSILAKAKERAGMSTS